MDDSLNDKYRALKSQIGTMHCAVVAFSGGIDSSLVAYVAAEVLGPRALAVTSGSASLKRSDLALTVELAERWGMRHEVIVTAEVQNPSYRANPVNRCFFCKSALYESLQQIAQREATAAPAGATATIVNGTNVDDLGDHRPGLIAADNFAVVSPLADNGFRKRDVRALAAHLGLENADKPQAACLSSRFPYGSHIDEARLAQVEAAESVLAELGFRQFRVRHHEDVARLEVDAAEIALAVEQRDLLQQRIKACGYRFVALDLGGFRSGSMNEGVIEVVNVAP